MENELDRAVLDWVQEHPGCQSAEMIRAGIGTSKEITMRVQELLRTGRLQIEERGKQRGGTYFGLIVGK